MEDLKELNESFDMEGRTHADCIFQMFRPYQAFALMRDHWQETLDHLRQKENAVRVVALPAEVEEARLIIETLTKLSDELKRIDDAESEQFNREEEAGQYDKIYAFLVEESRHLKKVAIKALASLVCLCGKPKKRGNSFCNNCYQSLPGNLRFQLYKPFEKGYPVFYDRACRTLKPHTNAGSGNPSDAPSAS
jgi:hypothetical protein